MSNLTTTKLCTKCRTVKPLSDFSKCKRAKTGVRSRCRICHGEETLTYYYANHDEIALKRKEYKDRMRDKISEYMVLYYEKNRDVLKAKSAKFRLENPEKVRAYVSESSAKFTALANLRRTRILLRTPRWTTEQDLKEIDKIYERCQQISQETGVPHQVDHVIPLRGKRVSGLHVPGNLQILTSKENLNKGNRYECT